MFEDVVNSGTIPCLERTAAFLHARHRLITENIANVDTPGYRAKHLDLAEFQRFLAGAMERRQQSGETRPTDRAQGPLPTGPSPLGPPNFAAAVTESPPENVLFHDGTNGRIEQQMATLAENNLMHEVVIELLRGRFEGLKKAIKGQVT